MSSSTEGSNSSDQSPPDVQATELPVGGRQRHSNAPAVFRLVLACFGFAVLLAGPAWLVAGSKGLIGLSAAAVLCTLPGCLVTGFRHLAGGSQATLMLAAGGIRMAFVLLGALVARFGTDGYGLREFFVWLILFYLFTLALETVSVLKSSEGQTDG